MVNGNIRIVEIDGSIIEREMNEQEIAQLLSDQENAKIKLQQEEEKRLLKISAYQKLGLTDDEIEALLPSPKKEKETNENSDLENIE